MINNVRKIISSTILIIFFCEMMMPSFIQAQMASEMSLAMTTRPFQPTIIQGFTFDANQPFQFNFIVDEGDDHLSGENFKRESEKLIRFFLASLTIPETDMWVNLNPEQPDKIIPSQFGKTLMGQNMLAQDYVLKQITASLLNPDTETGRELWDKIYKQVYEKYKTSDIPMETLSRVWIVPDEAEVYVNGSSVFVAKARLKVMLDKDYKKQKKADSKESDIALPLLQNILLPILEKELNEGKSFAGLRQIYHSLILATWYKRKLVSSSSPLKNYINQRQVKGIDEVNPDENKKIYNQYLLAFNKGTNVPIQEEYDQNAQQIVARKYICGGVMVDLQKLKETATRPDFKHHPLQELMVSLKMEDSDYIMSRFQSPANSEIFNGDIKSLIQSKTFLAPYEIHNHHAIEIISLNKFDREDTEQFFYILQKILGEYGVLLSADNDFNFLTTWNGLFRPEQGIRVRAGGEYKEEFLKAILSKINSLIMQAPTKLTQEYVYFMYNEFGKMFKEYYDHPTEIKLSDEEWKTALNALTTFRPLAYKVLKIDEDYGLSQQFEELYKWINSVFIKNEKGRYATISWVQFEKELKDRLNNLKKSFGDSGIKDLLSQPAASDVIIFSESKDETFIKQDGYRPGGLIGYDLFDKFAKIEMNIPSQLVSLEGINVILHLIENGYNHWKTYVYFLKCLQDPRLINYDSEENESFGEAQLSFTHFLKPFKREWDRRKALGLLTTADSAEPTKPQIPSWVEIEYEGKALPIYNDSPRDEGSLASAPGGVDFNMGAVTIDEQGSYNASIDSAQLNDQGNVVAGYVPVVISIEPVKDLTRLLGGP